MMETIILQTDLYEELAKNASQVTKTINDLVNEAVAYYLREQQRLKLNREILAYEQHHPELKQNYLGQWVAMHEQKLIDHDHDGLALYRRIRAKYGHISVLIRQVAEQPIEEVWQRTVSTGKVYQ